MATAKGVRVALESDSPGDDSREGEASEVRASEILLVEIPFVEILVLVFLHAPLFWSGILIIWWSELDLLPLLFYDLSLLFVLLVTFVYFIMAALEDEVYFSDRFEESSVYSSDSC